MQTAINAKLVALRGSDGQALVNAPLGASLNAGKFIGGVVRLAFHDAADFEPASFNTDGLRADGCINLMHPSNSGLNATVEALDVLWRPFCSLVSRADFWVLAAKTLVERSTPYVQGSAGLFAGPQPPNQPLHAHWHIPFRYGRVDRANCNYPLSEQRHPSAEGGVEQIERFIMRKFNLDARHAVALLGAHTLGHASPASSGYNGTWKERPDVFTTQFFRTLAGAPWKRVVMTNPHTGANISQWNIVPPQPAPNQPPFRNQYALLLNTDMAMMFNVSGTNTGSRGIQYGEVCSPPRPNAPGPQRCPFSSAAFPQFNFTQHVQFFAAGDQSTQDEPGASRFMLHFANAFARMSEAGYNASELSCAYCPPSACSSSSSGCSQDAICRFGALDAQTDSSVQPPPRNTMSNMTPITQPTSNSNSLPNDNSTNTVSSSDTPLNTNSADVHGPHTFTFMLVLMSCVIMMLKATH